MININPFEDMWKRDSYDSIWHMIKTIPILCVLYFVLLVMFVFGMIVTPIIDFIEFVVWKTKKLIGRRR